MATFNFTYDPGTTVQQMLGMEIAGRVWSRYLTDNTTLNIHVGVTSASSLGSNIIGGALPGMRANQSYADYRTALNNGPKSTDDITAVNSLTTDGYMTAFQSVYGGSLVATGSMGSQTTLNMTRAVAKAAGLTLNDSSTALDGYILFSNLANATVNGQAVRWSYDYTRSSTQASNTLDFLSTAIHELGHVLGFVSGVDQPGWLAVSTFEDVTYRETAANRTEYANPLDLFRYSASTASVSRIDMTYGNSGGAKFFSLDRGQTAIADFATGIDTTVEGDGYQASHWKNGTTAIMNPTLSLNSRRNVATLDLRAMDVIGWDIASTGINTTIDLSSLQTQSRQALATRSGQSTTWITNNLTASPTALVANRDQMIYSMMQNSVVYDLTRITNPGSTGTISRQTLAQVFQQRSLFSTVDELDGWVLSEPSESALTGLTYDLSSLAPLAGEVVSATIEATGTPDRPQFRQLGVGFQGLTADQLSSLAPTQALGEFPTVVLITPDALTPPAGQVDASFSRQRSFAQAYDGGMRRQQPGAQPAQTQPAEFDNLLLLEMAMF